MMVPYFLALEAQVELEHGSPRNAIRLFEQARAHISRTGERWFSAEICRLLGRAALALSPSRPDDARSLYREAAATAANQGARFWELRAELALVNLDVNDRSARQRVSRLMQTMGANSKLDEIKLAQTIADETSAVGS